MKRSIIIVLCLVLRAISSFKIGQNGQSSKVVGVYGILEPMSIRNCYCGTDQLWKNGRCVHFETSVDVILSFYPGIVMKQLKSRDATNVTVEDVTCNDTETRVVLNNVALNTDRSLFQIDSGNVFFDYCFRHTLDPENNIVTEAEVCLPPIQIPSCCHPQQVLDVENLRCSDGNSSSVLFEPPVRIGKKFINRPIMELVQNSIVNCNRENITILRLHGEEQEEGRVSLQYQMSNVILYQKQDRFKHKFASKVTMLPEYCVGLDKSTMGSENDYQYAIVVWDEDITSSCGHVLYLRDKVDECDRVMYWFLLPLLIISTIFLFVILILHVVMAELRKSLGGKITLCHVVSFFVAFCVLLALHAPYEFNCKIYGPLVQMCFLAAFFWLNVMCFDLWWKLRCRYPAQQSKESADRKFVNYSLYAWGSPLVIGVVTVIMDNVDFPPSYATWIVKPGFGEKYCWFVDRKATLMYYFGIIGLLMIANLIFFVWICAILIKANCTYKKVLKNNLRAGDRSWIYLRVFSVMGITWIFEFFSWTEGTCEYWIITDVINSLRGFVLFVILFGNRKSATKIREKFIALNTTVHTRVSHSVNSLRKLSLRSTSTFEGGSDSRRTSDTIAELNPH